MTNIDDFINWWRGFRDGIGSANITQEHLNMIDRKINGLQELWDISLPSKEEQEDVYPPPIGWPDRGYGWPYVPPFQFPKITPDTCPRVPDIWCRENQQYPRVGTPEGFGTPRQFGNYQAHQNTSTIHHFN